MFSKIKSTQYPPQRPTMVWDGTCGFCKYWVTRWQSLTQDNIDYQMFQNVADQFPDIPIKEFKKASRLIEPDGSIYSGPDSAYRSYDHIPNKNTPYHKWYVKFTWFRVASDHTYNFIAKNRPTFFKVTKLLLGKDSLNFKPYWAIYLCILVVSLYILFA